MREYIIIQFFICMIFVIFNAQRVDQFFSFALDMSKMIFITINVMRFLECESEIDIWSKSDKSMKQLEIDHIKFKNIHFSYFTRYLYKFCQFDYRLDIFILKKLNLDIKFG